MTVETVQSETVFYGKVFNVRKDQIRLPDGQILGMEIVEHKGAVTIIPLDEQEQIWFIRQYRHPAGQILFELPAGVMEESENPVESAQRELREETGMAADQLRLIGEFFLAPGYSTEYMYVFLATGLHAAPLRPDEGEFIEIEKIPSAQALALAADGKVRDAKSLAALLLWQVLS
jgi:ADP-ribose pyrophosphatase